MSAKNIIKCRGCNYLDESAKFFSIDTEEGRKAVKKFTGLNPDNQFHRGFILSEYAGVICPKCGNYSDFDLIPETIKNI